MSLIRFDQFARTSYKTNFSFLLRLILEGANNLEGFQIDRSKLTLKQRL